MLQDNSVWLGEYYGVLWFIGYFYGLNGSEPWISTRLTV